MVEESHFIPKSARMQFYLVAGLAFGFSLGWNVSIPILPLYIGSVGASKLEIGLIMASLPIVSIMARIPVGMISEKLGKWPIITCAIILQLISFVLYSLVRSSFWFFPVTAIFALAHASFGPMTLSVVLDLPSINERGKISGEYFTSIGAAMVFGPLLTSLMTRYLDYSTIFLLAAIFPLFSVIAIVISRVYAFDGRRHKGKDTLSPKPLPHLSAYIRKGIGTRNVLFIGLASVTFFFATGTIRTLFPIYLEEALFFTPSLISILFTLRAISNVLTRLPAGVISDKIGRRKPLILSYALTTTALLGISQAENFFLLGIVMLIYGIGWGLRIAPETALLVDSASSDNFGTILSLLWTFNDVGLAVGSVAAGWMTLIFANQTIFQISALVLILGTLAATRTTRN